MYAFDDEISVTSVVIAFAESNNSSGCAAATNVPTSNPAPGTARPARTSKPGALLFRATGTQVGSQRRVVVQGLASKCRYFLSETAHPGRRSVPKRTSIGVDIGSSAVRAAEVVIEGKRSALQRFAQVGLPPGAVVEGEVRDQAAVTAALKRLWAEGGFPPPGRGLGREQSARHGPPYRDAGDRGQGASFRSSVRDRRPTARFLLTRLCLTT